MTQQADHYLTTFIAKCSNLGKVDVLISWKINSMGDILFQHTWCNDDICIDANKILYSNSHFLKFSGNIMNFELFIDTYTVDSV